MIGPWRQVGVDPYPQDKERVIVCYDDDEDVWRMDNTRSNMATFRDYGHGLPYRWILESEHVHGYMHIELETDSVQWWAPLIDPPREPKET